MKAVSTLILETSEMLSWYNGTHYPKNLDGTYLCPFEKVNIENFDIKIQEFAKTCDIVIYKDTTIDKSKVIIDNIGLNVAIKPKQR